MGSPKRIRKKYDKPKMMWDRQRIDEEHKLKSAYGLKNLRELWRVTSEIRRVRKNVREVLAGRETEKVGKDIVARLAKYSIVNDSATLDDLLVITPESILERRLQTLVFKKGLARSLRQSRQLITHGFISVSGRRVRVPSYLVTKHEEGMVSYYKPIDINPPKPKEVPASAAQQQVAAQQSAQPAQQSGEN